MQTDFKEGIGTPDEQRLGGRVAGFVYLTGGITASGLQLIPGVGTDHWMVLAVLSLVAVTWGTLCLTVIDFSRARRVVFFLPGILALLLIGTAIASSGGVTSPARYFVMFVVVYAACFYRPSDAMLLIGLAILTAASPIVYESGSVTGPYVGEQIVLGLAYLALGITIIQGKKLLISARTEAQELALHDPLTGLANRRAVLQWLEGRMAGREKNRLGLILVDLDGFKDVNTLHGYQAGDHVLCEAARALEGCVRTDDLVARLGGDEFAVLVPDSDIAAIDNVGAKVIDCMRGMNDRLDLPGVRVTASVGWVAYPRDAGTLDELVKVADSCLRNAKAMGKDRALSPVHEPDPVGAA